MCVQIYYGAKTTGKYQNKMCVTTQKSELAPFQDFLKHLDRTDGSEIIKHFRALATFSCQRLSQSSRVKHISVISVRWKQKL